LPPAQRIHGTTTVTTHCHSRVTVNIQTSTILLMTNLDSGEGDMNSYNDMEKSTTTTTSSPNTTTYGTTTTTKVVRTTANVVDFDSLLDMDVVMFEKIVNEDDDHDRNDNCDPDNTSPTNAATTGRRSYLGAMQDDGTIAPLSTWIDEPLCGTSSMEFVVDKMERYPGYVNATVRNVRVIPEQYIYYGSRQVDGGKGADNPHGELSELLYYVDAQYIDTMRPDLSIVVKPYLEILW
jgi:hypothetical protein